MNTSGQYRTAATNMLLPHWLAAQGAEDATQTENGPRADWVVDQCDCNWGDTTTARPNNHAITQQDAHNTAKALRQSCSAEPCKCPSLSQRHILSPGSSPAGCTQSGMQQVAMQKQQGAPTTSGMHKAAVNIIPPQLCLISLTLEQKAKQSTLIL